MRGGCFPVNNIELQIHTTGNQIIGDSYHYLDIDNYVKKNFTGTYSQGGERILLQEQAVTTFKIAPNCSVCIKHYELTYKKYGNKEELIGGWTGNIMNTWINCDPGSIILTRVKESAFKEVPEISVDTGIIKLDFYDNGEIDGDSITVRVNKKVVLQNQRLSLKPITLYISIRLNNTFQEVEMVAENEGSIPPNTALLIITAGSRKYELFMSSTEEKSARVRFVYKKPVPLP
ncbi:MAG: hypothetical protein NVS1B13_20790 [Flavisolibacter sp.]